MRAVTAQWIARGDGRSARRRSRASWSPPSPRIRAVRPRQRCTSRFLARTPTATTSSPPPPVRARRSTSSRATVDAPHVLVVDTEVALGQIAQGLPRGASPRLGRSPSSPSPARSARPRPRTSSRTCFPAASPRGARSTTRSASRSRFCGPTIDAPPRARDGRERRRAHRVPREHRAPRTSRWCSSSGPRTWASSARSTTSPRRRRSSSTAARPADRACSTPTTPGSRHGGQRARRHDVRVRRRRRRGPST